MCEVQWIAEFKLGYFNTLRHIIGELIIYLEQELFVDTHCANIRPCSLVTFPIIIAFSQNCENVEPELLEDVCRVSVNITETWSGLAELVRRW